MLSTNVTQKLSGLKLVKIRSSSVVPVRKTSTSVPNCNLSNCSQTHSLLMEYYVLLKRLCGKFEEEFFH